MASGTQVPYIVKIDVTADASSGINYTLIHPGRIADAWFVTTTLGGAVTLNRQAQGVGAFSAVSSAMAAAAANDLTRTVDVIAAQAVCAAGDVLQAYAASSATRGYLFVSIVQDPQQ